jgi:hypothetical protein
MGPEHHIHANTGTSNRFRFIGESLAYMFYLDGTVPRGEIYMVLLQF